MTIDYAAKARAYKDDELAYALGDIKSTLALHLDKPPSDPYVEKLFREWDAMIEEAAKRHKKQKAR
jgi:hypothetical protein